jgi:hypothetical protein
MSILSFASETVRANCPVCGGTLSSKVRNGCGLSYCPAPDYVGTFELREMLLLGIMGSIAVAGATVLVIVLG